jgi:hypothetical protein
MVSPSVHRKEIPYDLKKKKKLCQGTAPYCTTLKNQSNIKGLIKLEITGMASTDFYYLLIENA